MTCKQCLYNRVCPHLKDEDADRCKVYTDKDEYVKVARCKDCTEWDEETQECTHWYGFKANDFCSYGVKK